MKKNILVSTSFILFILFVSCNTKTPEINLSVYKGLSISLRQSNYEIENQIMILQKSFERDTANGKTSYHAKIWQSKATLIQSYSNEIFQYLDKLKISLKTESGIKLVNMTEYWAEGDFKGVDNLFKKKGKGEELKQRILEYENTVMAVDSSMALVFQKSVDKTIWLTDVNNKEPKTFTETFFNNIPAIAALALLQKFENDIRNLEIQLITYCYQQIPR